MPTLYEAYAGRGEAAEGELDQGFKPISVAVRAVLGEASPSIEVKGAVRGREAPDAKRLPSKGKGRAVRQGPAKPRKKRKQGGWDTKRGLTLDEVKAAHKASYAAHSVLRGIRRLIAISINPRAVDGEGESERKRRLGNMVADIAQAFTRGRGQEWIAMTIWQWPVGGRLHCHVLAWIDPEHDDVLARLCDGADIHAQPWGRDIGYFTRARLPSGPPDYEARQKWPRVGSNPIKGRRLSLSPRLQDLVTEHVADNEQHAAARPVAPALAQPVAITPLLPAGPAQLVAVEEATGQFALILGSLDNPITAAEVKRKALGLRQEDLADAMGIARPTLANVVAGRYRPSPWTMARAAEFLRAA